jgi:uncharacterized protein (AIM24 family)
METLPNLIPPKGKAQTYADVAFHVADDIVPVLTIDVSKTQVYFEQHTLLWKHPSVVITLREPNGGMKKAAGGDSALIAEASGAGMIAFRRDGPGRIVTLQMPLGREMHVHEHRFLAATRAVSLEVIHVRGASGILHQTQAYNIHKFIAGKGDGVLWLYAYGQVFEKTLEDGESIDVEPGAWLYKDVMVGMETIASRLPLGRFGNHAMFYINRFTGPGRIAVQSMYMRGQPMEP